MFITAFQFYITLDIYDFLEQNKHPDRVHNTNQLIRDCNKTLR